MVLTDQYGPANVNLCVCGGGGGSDVTVYYESNNGQPASLMHSEAG